MPAHPMNVVSKTRGHADRQVRPLSKGTPPSLLDDALAAAADWVWEADQALRVTRLSPTFTEGTGIPPGDVVGRTLEELLLRFQIDHAELTEQIQALASHAPFRNLALKLWDGGSDLVRHFLLSGRPILDASGQFAGYRGIGLEVTRQAERQSRESEGRFRAIFDHAALGIALVAKGGRVARVNQALVAMFGFSPQEFARHTLRELTHPDDRESDCAEARRLVRREVESYSRENRYRRKDGSFFWGRLTVSLLPADGDDRFAVAMIEDIDDRKRAEANLSLFRAVMDSSHEAIAILSPVGHILYANSAP
ncbi:MAG: PAS domain S-box protein [Pseudomonadota bacterium]